MSIDPTRRRYLLTAGAALSAALAGCQGDSTGDGETTTDGATPTSNPTTTSGPGNASTETPTDDDLPTDTTPDDGYPPAFEDPPEAMEFDPESLPTRELQANSGATVEVPLIPLDVAYNLYARGESRVIDARAPAGYRVSHVLGSVSSPAPDGGDDDPTESWDVSDPVVIYCHCPTHLSIQRGANLIDNGFEEVYALQGGYQAWKVADYPTDGEGVPPTAETWTIEGTTDADDADGIAYVYHRGTDQVAGTTIGADGSYTLEFSFASVSGSDTATVGTPSYEVDGTLEGFTTTTVTADTEVDGESTATNGTATPTTTNGTATNGTDGNSTDDDAFGRLVGGRFR